jgi:hypothetical protein
MAKWPWWPVGGLLIVKGPLAVRCNDYEYPLTAHYIANFHNAVFIIYHSICGN